MPGSSSHLHGGADGPQTHTLETAEWELRERTRGGWWLASHLHGGAGGLTDGTRETAEWELREGAWGSCWATCTGEWEDHGPTP